MTEDGAPDVTIVVPTRERVEYLRVSLHSILASAAEAARHGIVTHVLVVDDASPSDATERLAAELGVGYARIAVHDGRNNPASAIALGVGLVRTRYFSLFGDDDLMLPRFIARHVAALEAGADVCTTDYAVVDAALTPVREVRLFDPELGDLLAGRISVNDGAMTRTSVAAGLEWAPERDQQILYAVWLELLYRGVRFAHLTETTFLYRRHTANISADLDDGDAQLRRDLVARYTALVLERDGAVPAASHPLIPVPSPRQRRFKPWRRITDRRSPKTPRSTS